MGEVVNTCLGKCHLCEYHCTHCDICNGLRSGDGYVGASIATIIKRLRKDEEYPGILTDRTKKEMKEYLLLRHGYSYDTGMHISREYEIEDLWECLRKTMRPVDEGGLTAKERAEIYGFDAHFASCYDVFDKCSPDEFVMFTRQHYSKMEKKEKLLPGTVVERKDTKKRAIILQDDGLKVDVLVVGTGGLMAVWRWATRDFTVVEAGLEFNEAIKLLKEEK